MEKKRRKKGNNKSEIIKILILAILSATITFAVVYILLSIFGGKSSGNSQKEQSFGSDVNVEEELQEIQDMNDSLREDGPDYYRENSEEIREFSAAESAAVVSEAEVTNELENRGFLDYPVSWSYSMDGTYIGENEITEASTDRHPMYSTYFVSSNEELWAVYSVNGQVMAYPVSYNLESEREAAVMVSEKSSITSYDGAENKFYERVPQSSELLVIVVDQINETMLNEMTSEVLANYEI